MDLWRVFDLPRRFFAGVDCVNGFDSRLLVTAAVILTVIQKVFAGPVPERLAQFPDLHNGERLALAPVIGLMLLIGILPQLIVDSVNPTVVNLLAHWRF